MMKKLVFIISILVLLILILGYYYFSLERSFEFSIEPKEPKNKIISVSEKFLNTPYKANTLIGPPEELVNNRQEVDCFTFLVRYKDCVISYETRNHYFTDWIKNNNLEYFVTTDLRHASSKHGKVLDEKLEPRKLVVGRYLEN